MGVYHTIHTLELQRKIPLGEVSRWRGRLYELSERYGTGVYSKSKDEQEFYMYAQKGVTINLRAAVNCGFIKLTINLNSVLYAEPQRVVLFCPDWAYSIAICGRFCVTQDWVERKNLNFRAWTSARTRRWMTRSHISLWQERAACRTAIKRLIRGLIIKSGINR